jgi:diketogulonate reductase-like aldo/keto reductase
VDYCSNKGIAIQAYSPLTRGKKLDDPILKSIAKEYSKSPAQVLLRWSVQKGFVCIPKSFHFDRIKDNAKVFEFEIEQPHMDVLNGLEEGFRTGRDKILWPWNG